MNEFARFHPWVNFAYFLSIIGFSMFFLHPLALVLSLVLSFSYAMITGGRKTLRFTLFALLPMMLLMIVINPIINHQGASILWYFPWGNPLTKESLCYGISAAAMLFCVILHFSSFNRIMTSDKLICLFGRLLPSLSLIFSMVLRFVPRFQSQLHAMTEAQHGIGHDLHHGSIRKRAKNSIRLLSGMVTWSLENAIDTADSMKSRGYGLPNRTNYTPFRFHKRDSLTLTIILTLALYILNGAIRGELSFTYFPQMEHFSLSAYQISLLTAYGALLFVPIIIELWEAFRWKTSQSKI